MKSQDEIAKKSLGHIARRQLGKQALPWMTRVAVVAVLEKGESLVD